ncbi:MAG: hypothetical protein ACXVX9_15215 [Mycobacteriaceae bacterium]
MTIAPKPGDRVKAVLGENTLVGTWSGPMTNIVQTEDGCYHNVKGWTGTVLPRAEPARWRPEHGDTVYVQDCKACGGSGSVDDSGSADCPRCDGQGWYVTPCRCGCYKPYRAAHGIKEEQ